jgi:predicted MPP superfamily phosphohydrolase
MNLNFSISKKNTKKFVWCTDTHFEFCTNTIIFQWIEAVQKSGASGVILSGDITNAKNIEQILIGMNESLKMPIYFVLGNHDCYGGSHTEVHQKVRNLCQYYPNLHFLDTILLKIHRGIVDFGNTLPFRGDSRRIPVARHPWVLA